MSVIYLFPGQGSQQPGMGDELFERYPRITAAADEILGYSIAMLCRDNPDERLGQTQYTQPALYTVNALMLQARIDAGGAPDLVAGHSLGEYNALLAANVFDFATGLRLVQKRGQIMAGASGGGMAAVLGLDADAVRGVLQGEGLDTIDVANYNAPTQTVVSGLRADVEAAADAFTAAGAKRYIVLEVSGAFHSRYMNEAAAEFGEFIAGFEFNAPRIPVIANIDAKPYEAGQVADRLTRQINNSVCWTDSLRLLLTEPEPEFEEVGSGGVLAGLLRQIQR